MTSNIKINSVWLRRLENRAVIVTQIEKDFIKYVYSPKQVGDPTYSKCPVKDFLQWFIYWEPGNGITK